MLQNTSAGLSEAEAKARLAKVGENRLRGKKGASVAAMFFSQFKDLMILILAAATLISVLMGEGTEAITIIIIVLMNATMGFLQEYRTEKTLEALKELSAPTARVRRSGRELEVGARTVVPGDVLLFEAGDKVAADCTLQTGVQVSCNEAMLTGESLPAAKQPGDRLYMGCIVMTGRGEGVVTATGMETEMGKIAGMMETMQTTTAVMPKPSNRDGLIYRQLFTRSSLFFFPSTKPVKMTRPDRLCCSTYSFKYATRFGTLPTSTRFLSMQSAIISNALISVIIFLW